MQKKQTKIVATISDMRCDVDFIQKLYNEGVDVFRLNTAHQNIADTVLVIKNIRKVSDRIAIMIDLKGPELRTSFAQTAIEIEDGAEVALKGGKREDVSTKELLYVNYLDFVKKLSVGTRVLIDDGELELEVVRKTKDKAICRALNRGIIKSYKTVNVPSVKFALPSLNEKDRDYLDFVIKNDIDFVAHSFVRSRQDVLDVQAVLTKAKSRTKIISKIESFEGVENLDEIIEVSYGIMVARGDLGIEMPAEDLPLIQKRIIKKCILARKPVIVATQVMHSMIKSPRPTRAEVSDVANAVLDGADAVMLSGETAFGEFPIETVKMMTRIIKKTEAFADHYSVLPLTKIEKTVAGYLIKAAVETARQLDIKEIVIGDETGYSAELISSLRSRIPVFVKSSDKRIVRELSLSYGIKAHYVAKTGNHEKFIGDLLRDLVAKGKLKNDDLIIYLAGNSDKKIAANYLEICEVDKYSK
jgi:pyruvate kinase